MSRMMKLLTEQPQLTVEQSWDAFVEGRHFAKALPPDPTRRRGTYSDAQLAFAVRSLSHMSIAVFMGGANWCETCDLFVGMRDGTDSQLEYPLPVVADKLRSLGLREREEAWHLFGKGFVL